MRKKQQHTQGAATPAPMPSAADFPAAVPPEVVAAVQQLYRAFAHRPVPTEPLNACTGCCMAPELEREMRELPLRALTQAHIWEYQDAAHGTPETVSEYAYYLPRVAEIISQGDPERVRHSIEIALDRLGNCPRDAFTKGEYQAVTAWAMALWTWYLAAGDPSREDEDLLPLFHQNADAVILMFGRAGLPVAPLLAAWVKADSDWALQQYALLAHDVDQSRTGFNAFADDVPELGGILYDWAFSSEVHRVFAQRWAEMSDARAAALLDGCYAQDRLVSVLGSRPRWLV